MFVRVKLHLESGGDVHILLRLYVYDPCVSGYCHFCARGFFVYARLALVCSGLTRIGAAFLRLCALDPCVRGSLSFVRADFPFVRGFDEDRRGFSSVMRA
jgi:hypothetical protein